MMFKICYSDDGLVTFDEDYIKADSEDEARHIFHCLHPNAEIDRVLTPDDYDYER